MYPLVDYYERIDARNTSLVRGAIYWTSFQFAYGGPKVERFHRDGRPIEELNVYQFNPSNNRADSADQTRDNEFLAVQKFKQRPVIVLSPTSDVYLESMQNRWNGGQHVLIAPIYSVWEETTNRFDVPSEFLLKVIRYDYSSAFFLPGSHTYDIISSIVRLEYTQAVHVSWLRKFGAGVKLTAKALQYLEEWFIHFSTGTVSEPFANELREFRTYLDEEGSVEINTTRFPTGLFDD
jgi:hypothetical protein